MLDQLMNDQGTGVEVRLNELYEHARRSTLLHAEFPTAKAFSRFMREQHQTGYLKQVIPNCAVDTSIHSHYEWTFHRQVAVAIPSSPAEALLSNNRHRDRKKTIITARGERVRSQQERAIHDALYKVAHFTFRYEFPLFAFGSNKDADFHIINNRTRKEYYWEHFGMTNSEYYKDRIADKVEWYSQAGFKRLEEGGNLIYTYYTDEHSFHRSIEQYITAIS